VPGSFVTGGAGFVGRHLTALLGTQGQVVVAPSHGDLDLLDGDALREAIAAARPEAIFHLAALASVARSWERPGEVLHGNLEMTLNLLEAARSESPDAVIVLASTGEVYGAPDELPVTEDTRLSPQNPYAVSKAACDLLAAQHADAHGTRVVRMRAFNHAGPGQSDDYVVGALTRQVAEAELAGLPEAIVRTGNPDSMRDFTDVRDVVGAYAAARGLEPGVYNVCSGASASVRTLLDLLGRAARVPLRHEIDPERVRAHDVADIRGSAERLRAATGWKPEIPLEQTVADALDAWRDALVGRGRVPSPSG
jgi:GDP-4-dehydro-6-deoxy-D-mannose reductase